MNIAIESIAAQASNVAKEKVVSHYETLMVENTQGFYTHIEIHKEMVRYCTSIYPCNGQIVSDLVKLKSRVKEKLDSTNENEASFLALFFLFIEQLIFLSGWSVDMKTMGKLSEQFFDRVKSDLEEDVANPFLSYLDATVLINLFIGLNWGLKTPTLFPSKELMAKISNKLLTSPGKLTVPMSNALEQFKKADEHIKAAEGENVRQSLMEKPMVFPANDEPKPLPTLEERVSMLEREVLLLRRELSSYHQGEFVGAGNWSSKD